MEVKYLMTSTLQDVIWEKLFSFCFTSSQVFTNKLIHAVFGIPSLYISGTYECCTFF